MKVYNLDEKVLNLVRTQVPAGDVIALVSRSFAKVWCDSIDIINSDFQHPEGINLYDGWSDASGTLTYQLDESLTGYRITILTDPNQIGMHYSVDVSSILW